MTKKNKQQLPVIVESEENRDIPEGLQLYLISFKWMKRRFVNLETGEEVKIKFWTKGGNVLLTPVLRKGRKILEHGKETKYITDAEGKIIDKKVVNKTRIVGREYGYKALASLLSAIYPCSVEKAKELVKEAISKNIRHTKLVLKSDLTPTSPDRYEGKNQWVVISDYPSTDKIEENVNAVLKAQGSPLRARFGLKWRLAE
jgi:hypothetical protein